MIKLKLPDPFNRGLDGKIQYQEWDRDWVPLMPLSFYFGGELDGVEINRVIWNGRSIPEHPPKPDENGIAPCPDRTVFDKIILRDGDELLIIPALQEPITAAVFGSAFAATFLGHGVSFAITYAISFMLRTIISYLTAPSKPKGQGMSSVSSLGWRGYENSYGLGGPIPVTFGKHRACCRVYGGNE